MIQPLKLKTFVLVESKSEKDRIKFPSSNRIKLSILSRQLIVVINFFVLICFLRTTVSSSHSFINNHINSIGAESDNFFEDDVSTGVSMCLPNYEVSEGSIIRTKDSIELGGRFLNESDLGVTGRDDCLRLCCRTPKCNVAVFEGKNSGSCYMFDCGSSEDFRCKFTSQIHYMSAILRRKEVQVPANIQQHTTHNNNGNNQHETELSQLRNQIAEGDKDSGIRKSVPVPSNVDVNNNNDASVVKSATSSPAGSMGILENNSRRCSRWQFECKSSGECIAIYNACDGILNCEDGSDEGEDLHCPSVGGGSMNNVEVKAPAVQQPLSILNNQGSPEKAMAGTGSNHSPQQQASSAQQSLNTGQQSTMNGKPDHIFNHKNSGIMEQSYGSQLQQQKHNNPFWKPQSPYNYGTEEQLPNSGFGQIPPGQQIPNNGLYAGNAMNNNNNYGIGGPGSYPGYPGQQQQGVPQSQAALLPYNNNPTNNNFNPQNSSPQIQQQYYGNNQIPAISNVNGVMTKDNANSPQQQQQPIFIPPRLGNGQPGTSQMIQKPLGQVPPTTSTTAPMADSKLISVTVSPPQTDRDSKGNSETNKAAIDGIKIDSEAKLEDEILKSLKNQPYSSETAAVHLEELTPHKAGPGAFLLFIIGLAMSIAMAVIVGCRLRRISSRRRRKNRLDPDYLVDGMYL